MDSNVFKQLDQLEHNRSGMGVGEGSSDDIDSILQYL